MYREDWAIVEEADIGGAGVSATLRLIVREWYWQGMDKGASRLVDPPAPYTTKEDTDV
jgi:hypothetical protein